MYTLFRRGWRPAVVRLQLETEPEEMDQPQGFRLESDHTGGFCGRWLALGGSHRELGRGVGISLKATMLVWEGKGGL